MTIKYNVMPRHNPRDPEAPQRYFPVVKSSGRTTQRGLARKGTEMSTLSAADLAAAMEVLLDLIPQELMEGNIVDLGDFNSFRMKRIIQQSYLIIPQTPLYPAYFAAILPTPGLWELPCISCWIRRIFG